MSMGKSALPAIILLLLTCMESPAQNRPVLAGQKPEVKLQLIRAATLDKADTTSVMILGDVMLHSRQLDYSFSGFFEHLSPAMSAADLTVANLEFSLGGKPYSGYPAFSAPDSIATVLAGKCGVDIFLTANNHILDRGTLGLERTLDVYSEMRDKFGTEYTGCSADSLDRERNNPLTVFTKGMKIALVNFTYGTNLGKGPGWPSVNYMKREYVEEAIVKAEKDGADFIIALPHWGTEYSLTHDGSQEEWAEWLISRGADAVVGSHPHVVQDTSSINGKPVIYSTGNVVSNMSAKNTRLGLAVILKFVHDFSTGEKRLLEPELVFTWCCLPGMLSGNYNTIIVKEWAGRRSDWLTPSDFDNMVTTLDRVKAATGIAD